MADPTFFTTGGTVQAGGGVYLSRRADEELLQLCQEGQFGYVLTPRQMGKSSLMVQTAERLQQQGIQTVIIDLTKIGTEVTAESWYLGLLTEIEDQLMLDTDVYGWWQQHEHLGVTQRLTRFVQGVLLAEVTQQIVIFVDEIDTTLSLSFTDDFFVAIRYFYTARAQNPELKRLSFVLIGVATPGDLIRDPQRTPFNVGQRVDLTDFSLEEALPFAAGLAVANEKQVLGWVLDWTHGHPYLTQRLCQTFVEQQRPDGAVAQSDIDSLVESTFLSATSQRQDNNLQFVRDMLTQRAPDTYEVLSVYRQVWRGRQPVLDEEQSIIKSHLKLSGAVRREEATGTLQVRNPIYRAVFDEGWVKEHLPVNWMKRLQRARAALAVMATVLFVAVPFGVVAEVRRREANELRLTAQENEQRAEQQAEIALNNEREAEKQAAIAERNAEDAQENAALAEKNAQEAQRQTDLAQANAVEAQRQTQAARANAAEAQRQAQIAQRQTALAEERLTEAEAAKQNAVEQRQIAEAARQNEADQRRVAERQRGIAENQTRLANEQRQAAEAQTRIAEQQTRLAQEQTILAQANASKGFLLGNQLLDALIAAVKAGKQVERENLQDSAIAVPAVVALQQGVYADKAFNLNAPYGYREKNQLSGHQGSVNNLGFSPDGKTLAVASGDGTVKLWDRDGTLLNTLEGHNVGVLSVSFGPDGNTLASGSEDGMVKLWDKDGTLLNTLEGHRGRVLSVSFSLDGNTLASGSEDGMVKLWDKDGTLLNTLEGHRDSVWSVSFSPDGNTLASGSSDGTVKLWDKDGTLLTTLEGHRGWVLSVSFSPDGNTLASGSEDGMVKLWDKDGTLLNTLEGHRDSVLSVSFSPDGSILASGSEDSTVKLWDKAGTLLNTLEGHPDTVYSVSFSPDGNTLASGSEDGMVKLWDKDGTLLNTL
ncbi:MAG: hypothetical protein F6K04_20285, partial [Leptolyngbya sp. SIO4C5]|nr:hypothetical protein [Leptolyngbya sp. SIO4C5]